MRWTRSPALVALFVVVDVVVIVLTYLTVHRVPATETAAPATGDDPATAVPTPLPIVGPLTLAASPSGRLARVVRGTCDPRTPVRARVWLAASYRAPLRRVPVPGLQEALGTVLTDTAVTLVGADRSCHVRAWVSRDDGRTWRAGRPPRDAWYVDTDTTKTAVHGPVAGGVANVDCRPTAVAPIGLGSHGLVTCDGFNVIDLPRQRDAAATTYSVQSPAAAAQSGNRMPLVLATSSECQAALQRVTSQATVRTVACLGNGGAPLGLAVAGRRVFAQVGERLLVSGDGGRTFSTYPGEGSGGQ